MVVCIKHIERKIGNTQVKLSSLPKVGDAVLFRNHNKTDFTSNFLPGYWVVKKTDDSNFVNKNTVNGQTSQVHLKDLIVSAMIPQVLDNMPSTETFGRYSKYANCPHMALKLSQILPYSLRRGDTSCPVNPPNSDYFFSFQLMCP